MNFLKFLVALTASLILTDLAPAQSESAQGAEDEKTFPEFGKPSKSSRRCHF